MLDDLVSKRKPPPNRARHCEGGVEHHLSEGAVILAFAMHLLRTVDGLENVAIHPDGEHGKRFDFRAWLANNDFQMWKAMGTTSYGGIYRSTDGKTMRVDPSPGQGDVVATVGEVSYVAECKGGVLNSK